MNEDDTFRILKRPPIKEMCDIFDKATETTPNNAGTGRVDLDSLIRAVRNPKYSSSLTADRMGGNNVAILEKYGWTPEEFFKSIRKLAGVEK
jgi:hypothetical protein